MNKEDEVFLLQIYTKPNIFQRRNFMVCFSEEEAIDWVNSGEEKYIQRCFETLSIYKSKNKIRVENEN